MNSITNRVLSGMSGDGFNERKGYVDRNNGLNNLNNNTNYDESLAQMRILENKPNIKTTNSLNEINNINNTINNDPSRLKSNVDMYFSFKRSGIKNAGKINNMNNFK